MAQQLPPHAVELRFTADGSLDTTYGSEGWFQGADGTYRWDIALHPQGRLLYVGSDGQGWFLVRKVG